jgi:heme exporter protein C
MLNNINPTKIFFIINRLQKYILILFLVVLVIGLLEALVFSPEDYKQSDSVRIMYVHVPAAWISLGIFSIISILSFVILIFKIKIFR